MKYLINCKIYKIIIKKNKYFILLSHFLPNDIIKKTFEYLDHVNDDDIKTLLFSKIKSETIRQRNKISSKQCTQNIKMRFKNVEKPVYKPFEYLSFGSGVFIDSELILAKHEILNLISNLSVSNGQFHSDMQFERSFILEINEVKITFRWSETSGQFVRGGFYYFKVKYLDSELFNSWDSCNKNVFYIAREQINKNVISKLFQKLKIKHVLDNAIIDLFSLICIEYSTIMKKFYGFGCKFSKK